MVPHQLRPSEDQLRPHEDQLRPTEDQLRPPETNTQHVTIEFHDAGLENVLSKREWKAYI